MNTRNQNQNYPSNSSTWQLVQVYLANCGSWICNITVRISSTKLCSCFLERDHTETTPLPLPLIKPCRRTRRSKRIRSRNVVSVRKTVEGSNFEMRDLFHYLEQSMAMEIGKLRCLWQLVLSS